MDNFVFQNPTKIYFGKGSISHLSEDTVRRQKETLENALNRSITYCYAVEGAYPQSLD